MVSGFRFGEIGEGSHDLLRFGLILHDVFEELVSTDRWFIVGVDEWFDAVDHTIVEPGEVRPGVDLDGVGSDARSKTRSRSTR